MKKIIVVICMYLYVINNSVLRRILRSIIAHFDGGWAFSEKLRIIMEKYHGIIIGVGSYGSCFNPEQAWVGYGNLTVGKFTSIAKGVCMYTRNHPYWYPSTSPLFYNAEFCRGGIPADTVPYDKLTIGNDVWIGQYAVILPSCKHIGDGAVIGAGSIITKDVPDYAVVAGNPGRVLKYRFDEDKIEQLKRIKWWDWDVSLLLDNAQQFQDIEALIEFSKNKSRINNELNVQQR